MKIAISHKNLTSIGARGGINTVYLNLAKEFSLLGHKVFLISGEKEIEKLKLKNLHTIFKPFKNYEHFSHQINKILKNLDFDIYECSIWRAEGLEYCNLPFHNYR